MRLFTRRIAYANTVRLDESSHCTSSTAISAGVVTASASTTEVKAAAITH